MFYKTLCVFVFQTEKSGSGVHFLKMFNSDTSSSARQIGPTLRIFVSESVISDSEDLTIKIVEASYGKNCNANLKGNQTNLSNYCKNKFVCAYKIDTGVIGDPARM